MHHFKSLVAAFTLVASAAVADESWMSEDAGHIIWEEDYGNLAMFSFEGDSADQRAHMYVQGLDSSTDDRDTFEGFWIDPAADGCGASLTGPDGLTSSSWGRMILTFDTPGFPSGWTALVGTCFEAPYYGIRAEVP